FRKSCDRTGYANAVGAHRDGYLFAVFVQDFQIQCFSIFSTQLENMSHFHAATGYEWSRTVRCWVAVANHGGFQDTVPGEVTFCNQAKNVLLIFIRPGDPTRAWHDARVNKKWNPSFRGGAEHLNGLTILHQ